jgi:TRAP transporter 4TM/12TM fusion protein
MDIGPGNTMLGNQRRVMDLHGTKPFSLDQFFRLTTASLLFFFQIYTAFFGVMEPYKQVSYHLLFLLPLSFLYRPIRSSSWWVTTFNYILAALSVGVFLYITYDFDAYITRVREYDITQLDYVVAFLGTVLILEGARRSLGAPLVLITASFLFYGLAGHIFPGFLRHRPFSIEQLLVAIFMGPAGIFGTPLIVCATIIFMFIAFGALLQATHISDYFIAFANYFTGKSHGGPAKAAIVSSAFMATISGSAVANVATTGAVTIPLMKKTGYQPHFAGAIEACASSGGQLTPPVMGAAAFIMAEFTGVPYGKVCIAAAIPALLFYVSIYCIVHLEAIKLGIRPVSRGSGPSLQSIVYDSYMLLPLAALAYLLITYSPPMQAALYCSLFVIMTSLVKASTRFSKKRLVETIDNTARSMIPVSTACGCAGVVIGVISMTGVGMKLAAGLISISQDQVFLLLILTAVASLILGMGLPTSACYIVLSILIAPALVKMGVGLLASHMFIFYYGVLAVITPPVAVAAYTAAGIAGADPSRTGFTACWIGLCKYIVPFMFVYNTALLADGNVGTVGINILFAIFGIISISIFIEGYLLSPVGFLNRMVFLLLGLLMLVKYLYLNALALLMLLAWSYYLWKKEKNRGIIRDSMQSI